MVWVCCCAFSLDGIWLVLDVLFNYKAVGECKYQNTSNWKQVHNHYKPNPANNHIRERNNPGITSSSKFVLELINMDLLEGNEV